MKLSNETKVGLLAITAIILLVLGFNFLKGSSIFSKPFVLYAPFSDIGALEKSNQVKINGLPIGTVADFKPADKEVNAIIVEVHINKGISIPKNSTLIIDGAILGSAFINVLPGDAHTYYQSGDTARTRIDPSLMSDLKAQIAPTLIRLNETFDSLKITIGALNSIFDPNTKNNLRSIIANLNLSSAELAQLLNTQSGVVARSFANIEAVTGNLARNNEVINGSLRNVNRFSGELATLDLRSTMSKLDATVTELQRTVGNINSKNGSLGLLMNDRQLHDNLNGVAQRLNAAALSMEILLDDVRVHPKRYVNFSLIGGGGKPEPLTSPAVKDTTRR